MPASRARTAICSAPLEWPSSPGLPTRNVRRRPSLRDTRSTSARMSSSPLTSLRMARPTPVGARYSPKASRSVQPHSPVVTPALAQAIDAGMILPLPPAARLSASSADLTARVVALRAPGFQLLDLIALGVFRYRHDRLDAAGERRGLALEILVDADHDLLAALDRFQPRGVGFDQLLLHVAALDRLDRAAHLLDALELVFGLALERFDLLGHHLGAVENIAVVEQVRFVSEDLLHAQRPLLVPRPRQAERLVPRRQLHGAGARVLRQRHRQHFEQDARDVVLRLAAR